MKPTASKIFCCNSTNGSIFDPELPLYIYIYIYIHTHTSFKKSMKSWFVTRLVPQIGNKSLYTPTRQLWKSNIENKILYNIYIQIYLMDPIYIYIIHTIPYDLNFHWIRIFVTLFRYISSLQRILLKKQKMKKKLLLKKQKMKKKLQLTLFFLLNTSINVGPFVCFGFVNAKCCLFWGPWRTGTCYLKVILCGQHFKSLINNLLVKAVN